MPSSILNSDDGVISGTSGLKSSGGDDAVLLIQTKGTTAQTIDAGQRTKFPTTIGVGNATPSTSGSGISFPATQSASTDANTLDDYEEGTWTATFVASGATFTNNARDTRYTKIGNLVTIMGYLQVNCSAGSGANAVTITGLPFTSLNTTYNYVNGSSLTGILANANGFNVKLDIAPNSTTIDLFRQFNDSGTTKAVTIKSQDITDANFSFRFSFSYTASA